MKKRMGLALAAAGAVAFAGAANAADIGVVGLKLIVLDKLAAASKAKAVLVIKDGGIDKGTGTDATQISGSMRVAYDTSAGEFLMPSGAGWLVNKDTVAKYVNKDAPGGAGAVKVAVVKPGKLLKAVLKDLGDSGNAIDIYGTGDPMLSSVDMATQFTVVDGATTRRHCGEFTGCARKIIAGGSGAKIVCKTATPGGSVVCPPSSPSGAFVD